MTVAETPDSPAMAAMAEAQVQVLGAPVERVEAVLQVPGLMEGPVATAVRVTPAKLVPVVKVDPAPRIAVATAAPEALAVPEDPQTSAIPELAGKAVRGEAAEASRTGALVVQAARAEVPPAA